MVLLVLFCVHQRAPESINYQVDQSTSRCESPDIVQDDQIADKIDGEETMVWQRARVQGDKVMWLTTASKDQVTATSTVGWIESNCYKS